MQGAHLSTHDTDALSAFFFFSMRAIWLAKLIVSIVAVIRVVTQRFSPRSVAWGEALGDDPNNGCEGDYQTYRCV